MNFSHMFVTERSPHRTFFFMAKDLNFLYFIVIKSKRRGSRILFSIKTRVRIPGRFWCFYYVEGGYFGLHVRNLKYTASNGITQQIMYTYRAYIPIHLNALVLRLPINNIFLY